MFVFDRSSVDSFFSIIFIVNTATIPLVLKTSNDKSLSKNNLNYLCNYYTLLWNICFRFNSAFLDIEVE